MQFMDVFMQRTLALLEAPQVREKCSVIYITWYTNASHTRLLIDANPINTCTHTHPQCHTHSDTKWEAAPLCVSGTQEWREQKRNEHFESKRSLGRAAGEWAVRERLGSSTRLLLTALREPLNLMARDGPRNCSLLCIGSFLCDIKLWHSEHQYIWYHPYLSTRVLLNYFTLK